MQRKNSSLSLAAWTLDEEARELRQRMGRLVVSTRGRAFLAIGKAVDRWLQSIDARDGLVTLFLRHTSASLTIQENTDPDVQEDFGDALDRLVPETVQWRHRQEGADDMPAHVKTALIGVSLQIPVVDGKLDLGTWQEIYVVEHRREARQRSLTLHYQGT